MASTRAATMASPNNTPNNDNDETRSKNKEARKQDVLTKLNGDSNLWTEHIIPFIGGGEGVYAALVSKQYSSRYKEWFNSLKEVPMVKIVHNTMPDERRKMEFKDTLLSHSLTSKRRAKLWHALDDRTDFYKKIPDTRICSCIALHGNLAVLKWAREHGIAWDVHTLNSAAFAGNAEILEWAHHNQCPWNERHCEDKNASQNSLACKAAASGRHKNHENTRRTLQLLVSFGCDMTEIRKAACVHGQITPLEFAHTYRSSNKCFFDIRSAAKNGHVHILEWAREHSWGPNFFAQVIAEVDEVLTDVAGNGHLSILEWASNNGCSPSIEVLAVAASKGHKRILQWARNNGHGHLIDGTVHQAAISGGQFEVLEWIRNDHGLKENLKLQSEDSYLHAVNNKDKKLLWLLLKEGCPCSRQAMCQVLDLQWMSEDEKKEALKKALEIDGAFPLSDMVIKAGGIHFSVLGLAAKNNEFELLKFIHNRDREIQWHWCICYFASKHNNLEMLQYARSNGCPWDYQVHSCAALNNSTEILEYAAENKCPWHDRTLLEATKQGSLDAVKLAHKLGCPLPASFLVTAARNGHLAMVEWACSLAPPHPCNEDVCSAAAEGNHLHVLKWLRMESKKRSRGRRNLRPLKKVPCPWDNRVIKFAAQRGNLEMLKFAHEGGCPWRPTTLVHAARGGHLEILKYAHKLRVDLDLDWDDASICHMAARKGQLNVLKWLKELTPPCPWDGRVCKEAARAKNLEMLEFAHWKGCPWNRSECLALISKEPLKPLLCEWVRDKVRTVVRRKPCGRKRRRPS